MIELAIVLLTWAVVLAVVLCLATLVGCVIKDVLPKKHHHEYEEVCRTYAPAFQGKIEVPFLVCDESRIEMQKALNKILVDSTTVLWKCTGCPVTRTDVLPGKEIK